MFGDEDEEFGLYSQLAHATQIVSSGDLSASKAWIRAAEDSRHSTLLLAHETSPITCSTSNLSSVVTITS